MNVVWSPQPGPQHAYVDCPLPIVFFGGARGGGKGVPRGSRIYTPRGLVAIEDVRAGDRICSVDGATTKVLAVFYRGIQPCYELTLTSGRKVICDGDHRWRVRFPGTSEKKLKRYGPVTRSGRRLPPGVWSTDKLYARQQERRSKRCPLYPQIPSPDALFFSGPPIGMDPYTLGLLLGDGCITATGRQTATMGTADPEIRDYLLSRGWVLRNKKPRNGQTMPFFDLEVWGNERKAIFAALDAMGLTGTNTHTKFVPQECFVAPVEERRAIIQGMMDTDGSCSKDGCAQYDSVNQRLVKGLLELVETMGGYGSLSEYAQEVREGSFGNTVSPFIYRARIRLDDNSSLFRLTRKIERTSGIANKKNWQSIVDIKKVRARETFCIKVDDPTEMFVLEGGIASMNTDGVLGKWAIKGQQFGRAFNAIMFRRSTVSAEDAIERSREIFRPLGWKFSESKLIWKSPGGARVSFKYLETVKDAQEYQGRNVTDAWVEEAGQYPEPDPIDRLHGVLRSKHGIQTQLTLTANPGGAGQHWLRDRFKLYPFPRKPMIVPVEVENYLTQQRELIEQAVIPSRIQDNRILLENDPQYVARLSLTGSAKLVRAWVLGDWSAIEGAFFDEWTTEIHVVKPFAIPDDALRFGAFDWGSAKPFSMGWYAVLEDDFHGLPAGAMIKYREWYGKSGQNKGLKLTAEKIAEGIIEREGDERINYRVADPAIFSEDGGPSHSERMANGGVIFYKADNKRVARKGAMGGWDAMHARLIGHGYRDDDGIAHVAPGDPMLYFFETCTDSIRTIPVIQHDERKAEDVDTDAEDHAADETRYACMSRPWTPEAPNLVSVSLDAWGRRKQDTANWRVA